MILKERRDVWMRISKSGGDHFHKGPNRKLSGTSEHEKCSKFRV